MESVIGLIVFKTAIYSKLIMIPCSEENSLLALSLLILKMTLRGKL